MKRPMLKELAQRIREHLARFERDPKINAHKRFDKAKAKWVPCTAAEGHGQYYMAGACVTGRYVAVSYVSFQGTTHLTREDAERYLAKLDAGKVGRHFELLK